MRRFFIDPTDITKGCATITDQQEARHIATVLRLKPGNTLELFDGNGMVYQAEITALGKTTVETQILASHHHREAPPFVSVAQAQVKGKKMDLIIQKATELGITAIQPIITQYVVAKESPAGQSGRWQRIVHESCKQCNRPTPLVYHPTITLDQLLARSDGFATKIFFWEDESTATLSDLNLQPVEQVLLLIGPEGGFAAAEAEAAIRAGFKPVSLGPRVMRAETASIAAMAIVQFLLGNLSMNL